MSSHLKGSTMHIEATAIHLRLTDPLARHIQRSIGRALDRFDRRVASVRVRLTDDHRRHGNELRCRAQVDLDGQGLVIVEEAGPDLYATIDGVAGRLKRAVRRQLARRRSVRRHHRRLAPASIAA